MKGTTDQVGVQQEVGVNQKANVCSCSAVVLTHSSRLASESLSEDVSIGGE